MNPKSQQKMVAESVFHISLLLLLMFQLAAAAATSMAKPGCQDHCGNISIPYPFGTTKDCYLDDPYKIVCDETAKPPRAFISKINMEVLLIENGAALVKGPIISTSSCSGRKSASPVNLTGTPFFFSFGNLFTAVGCNIRALLTEIGPQVSGCHSTCGDNYKPTTIMYGKEINSICDGKNCCVAQTPPRMQLFYPILETKNGSEDSSGCSMSFLANEGSFVLSNATTQEMQAWEYAPVMLAWLMDYNIWRYDNRTMSCKYSLYESTSLTNISTYECSCGNGYQGNPYLGCIDINECKDANQHSCRGITKCVNTPGSYKCEVNKYWIVLIVAGAIAGVVPLLIGISRSYQLARKRRDRQLRKKFFKRNGGLLLQQQLTSDYDTVQKTKIFSSKELERATNHFNKNRILGQGGQGTVYKGMLEDGRIVAVKKSKIVGEEKLEEFINEVAILSQINHRNVVKLHGCCLETEVPLLVYEFISNGHLFQYLHNYCHNEEFTLSWEMRLRIAKEVAGALSYLHSAASIPIYHRDVKSTNILLDEKYRAKVSDFGTARSISVDQTHLTTKVQGTFGYLDPQYFRSSQFTDKSDVYSFGVVLVELLSGRKPILTSSSQETRSLASHFIVLMEENRLFDILDAQVKELFLEEEVVAVANLAKRCLNVSRKLRPTMKEVSAELERIGSLRRESNIELEETENTTGEGTFNLDAVPISTTYDFGNARVQSSEVFKPLITHKTL